MPQVEINSSTAGPALINYTLSTPTLADAHISQLDPTLPTVIFLHAVYIGQAFFHPQFSDPDLRRFNLLALDFRCHGLSVGSVPETYREADAAEDVFRFMEALNLPPCHIFGVSFSACVALKTAIDYPDRVASLYLLSPLPPVEPEIAAEGRQEIYDCWVEANKDPEHVDQEALLDSILGALSLGFNQSREPIVHALVASTTPKAQINWAVPHFREFHTISVDFFTDRKDHSIEDLKRLKRLGTRRVSQPPSSTSHSNADSDIGETVPIPIHIVHCSEDIAYPFEFAEALRDRLVNEAELGEENVKLTQIKGAPHLGCVTHPETINPTIHDWIVHVVENTALPPPSSSSSPAAASQIPIPIPPAKSADTIKSPFEEELARCGLYRHRLVAPGELVDDDDESDMEEIELIPMTPPPLERSY